MLHEIVAGFAVYFDSLQRANPRFSQVALRADAVTTLCFIKSITADELIIVTQGSCSCLNPNDFSISELVES